MGDPNGDNAVPLLIGLVGVIFAIVMGVVIANAHDRSISTPATPSPQVTVATTPDPKSSVVTLPNGVSEFCNGTTMIYKTTQALTAEPNSSECQP